jgi:hypothetical protein
MTQATPLRLSSVLAIAALCVSGCIVETDSTEDGAEAPTDDVSSALGWDIEPEDDREPSGKIAKCCKQSGLGWACRWKHDPIKTECKDGEIKFWCESEATSVPDCERDPNYPE